MSRVVYSYSSWFYRFPLKWVNGLYSCTDYQPHYILNKYLCSKCEVKHPLDTITAVTECTATEHLRQAIINSWPPSFNTLISDCGTTATLGDRCNFTRTLIPNSLSNILRSPLPALSYTQHRNHLYTAMKTRRQRLKTILQDVQQWLRDNLIPDLHTLQPHTTYNPWRDAVSIYSTSAHHPTPLSFPKIKSAAPLNKHPNKTRSTATRRTVTKANTLHLNTPPASTAPTSHVTIPQYFSVKGG